MEKLKQLSETINLGKKLVEEFSHQNRISITSRWMSHYLAELILAAENEHDHATKDRLQTECSRIILDLWSRRQYFPRGTAPLSKVNDALDILKSLGEIKANQPLWMGFRHDDDASPWGTYMSKLRANFEDSVRLILNANTVADLLTKEHEWLSHESLLSEDEKTALKRLDDLLSKDYGFFQLKIIKTNPDEQDEAITMTMVFDKLNALLKSQEQELLKLKEQILPSTSNNSEVDEDL
jgi:hypothetical protein